ncbi:MAG: hypothetical protein U0K54_06040 [Acutalibacteraceae bacterium]|nr:hypothetical protein [Acutalibacteraceae bacterium]
MGVFSKFSIRKLLYNKKFAIILSAVLAFVIWLSIVINQTPVIERTITNIPIVFETKGTVAGDYKLEVVNYGGTRVAEVKVSGPAYVVSKLTADDIDVRLVLSSVSEPNEYNVQVRASQKVINSEYSIISVTPSSLNLKFDRISEKVVNTADIVVEANVKAESGFQIYKKAVSTAVGETVVISGPRTQVEKIHTVKAIAKIEGDTVLSEAKTYSSEIALYDADGNKLDSTLFDISAKDPEVYVAVYKTKTIELEVDLDNQPPAKRIKYDRKIKIMGPNDVIAALKGNKFTCTIDYNKVKVDKNTFKVNLTEFGLGAEVLTNKGDEFIIVTLY